MILIRLFLAGPKSGKYLQSEQKLSSSFTPILKRNVFLQPVASQLVKVNEVEFLEPATVSNHILHYFSTKWNGFHGSMKKGIHVSPRHDATIFQHDVLSEMNNILEELEDLEFLYAHGAQFEE
jgi:hypothetical protein